MYDQCTAQPAGTVATSSPLIDHLRHVRAEITALLDSAEAAAEAGSYVDLVVPEEPSLWHELEDHIAACLEECCRYDSLAGNGPAKQVHNPHTQEIHA